MSDHQPPTREDLDNAVRVYAVGAVFLPAGSTIPEGGIIIYPAAFKEPATPIRATEVVHRCPEPGTGTMPCCGRTPFEVPRFHRLALSDAFVTCTGS